jgi:hypothetical protein
MRSDMELLGSVEVHKSRLEQDSFGLDLVVHLGDSFQHKVLIRVGPNGLRLSILNNLIGIVDGVNVGDEGSVVNHTGTISDSVAVDKVVDLDLAEADVEGAETSAELY